MASTGHSAITSCTKPLPSRLFSTTMPVSRLISNVDKVDDGDHGDAHGDHPTRQAPMETPLRAIASKMWL